jgi:N-methylhydantoinase A/oxoprolinase/acetone carboxylase beta subunit
MIMGLDVGGTHKDVVLLDNQGLRYKVKVLTDPSDLFNSVISELRSITEKIAPSSVDCIVLSTTFTTDAVVQDKTLLSA